MVTSSGFEILAKVVYFEPAPAPARFVARVASGYLQLRHHGNSRSDLLGCCHV